MLLFSAVLRCLAQVFVPDIKNLDDVSRGADPYSPVTGGVRAGSRYQFDFCDDQGKR